MNKPLCEKHGVELVRDPIHNCHYCEVCNNNTAKEAKKLFDMSPAEYHEYCKKKKKK